MKRVISFLLSFIILVSLCIPASASSATTESAAVGAKDLIILIPGIMGTELQYESTKVWDPGRNPLNHPKYFNWLYFNESGAATHPISVLNDDNYGATDAYKTIYNRLHNAFSPSATV